MAAVKIAPYFVLRAVIYTIWLVLGGVDSVSPFITLNQIETSVFTILLYFTLRFEIRSPVFIYKKADNRMLR